MTPNTPPAVHRLFGGNSMLFQTVGAVSVGVIGSYEQTVDFITVFDLFRTVILGIICLR